MLSTELDFGVALTSARTPHRLLAGPWTVRVDSTRTTCTIDFSSQMQFVRVQSESSLSSVGLSEIFNVH